MRDVADFRGDAPLGENNGGLGRLVDVVRGIQKKAVKVEPKSSEWWFGWWCYDKGARGKGMKEP